MLIKLVVFPFLVCRFFFFFYFFYFAVFGEGISVWGMNCDVEDEGKEKKNALGVNFMYNFCFVFCERSHS
jgi:hypothetical protein